MQGDGDGFVGCRWRVDAVARGVPAQTLLSVCLCCRQLQQQQQQAEMEGGGGTEEIYEAGQVTLPQVSMHLFIIYLYTSRAYKCTKRHH